MASQMDERVVVVVVGAVGRVWECVRGVDIPLMTVFMERLHTCGWAGRHPTSHLASSPTSARKPPTHATVTVKSGGLEALTRDGYDVGRS